MKLLLFLFLYAFIFSSCKEEVRKDKSSLHGPETKVLAIKTATKTSYPAKGNSANEGVVVFNWKEDNVNRAFTLYNENGSKWKSLELNDHFNDDDIRPYAIKPENALLVFRCIGKYKEFYIVVINEAKHLKKLIRQSDQDFKFQLWKDHIVSEVFSVEFNYINNPIKSRPSTHSKGIIFNKETFYHPVKVDGDWLMIKDDNEKGGWIKWHDLSGNLIITLYYEA